MKKSPLLSAAALAVLCHAPLAAETPAELAAMFGVRQSVEDITLSPSGTKVAFIAPDGPDDDMLYVVDVAGGVTRPVLSTSEPNSQMRNCAWATDERLVCEVRVLNGDKFDVILGISRMIAVGADGSNVMVLTADNGVKSMGLVLDGGDVLALHSEDDPNRILMTRVWSPQFSTGTRTPTKRVGYGVETVDVSTGKRSIVEEPEDALVDFIADENGRVRIMATQPTAGTGYVKPVRIYSFRPRGSRKWEELSQVELGAQRFDGFLPVAVDSGLDVVYGFNSIDGYQVVERMALDGTGKREVVVRRDGVDVNSLIRIGRQQRVVGASYATDRRQVDYFDEPLKKLASDLQRALPGSPLINIVDASADEQQLLIVASGDTNPGMIYLYDKGTRQLSEVLPLRGQLVGREMGEMKPISFAAADGTTIPGYLTLPPGSDGKNLPAIVLPHGGPGARDEWGFDWLVQFLAARGYAVLQPNFRGSAGYGDAWFGENGFQAWKTAIGDVDDAGRWLVREGIADPAKLAIVGWSYGGYAALQSQVVDPQLFKAVAAIAPVTDLEMLKTDSKRYLNYTLVKDFIGEGPHVVEGSPARNTAAFVAPVILFHGTLDSNVDIEQSRVMRDRLKDAGKQVDYVEFKDQTHSITGSAARIELLTKLDEFLTNALKR